MELAPFTYLRHYKGGIYRVLSTATHTETDEEVIVYYSMSDGKQWVRPLSMFSEIVEYKGKVVKRFEIIDIEVEDISI